MQLERLQRFNIKKWSVKVVMKKLVRAVLVTAVACGCLTACGKTDSTVKTVVVEMKDENLVIGNSESEQNDVSFSKENTDSLSEADCEEQVQIMFDHCQWLSYSPNVNYAFCDLDGNGRMEVIVCERNEAYEVLHPKFYEVSADYSDVQECSFETNCYIYDIDNSTCEGMYVNPDTGARSYLMKSYEEYEGKQLFYYYELVLSNGNISQYAVCSENPLGYYNSNFERIDESEFNIDAEIDRYFEGKTFYNAPAFLFDPLEGDGMHEKMYNSIRSFFQTR